MVQIGPHILMISLRAARVECDRQVSWAANSALCCSLRYIVAARPADRLQLRSEAVWGHVAPGLTEQCRPCELAGAA